jgi:hypothetical protein
MVASASLHVRAVTKGTPSRFVVPMVYGNMEEHVKHCPTVAILLWRVRPQMWISQTARSISMEVTAHRVAQVGIMATLQHGAALMVSGNLEESDALIPPTAEIRPWEVQWAWISHRARIGHTGLDAHPNVHPVMAGP